jgi:predicted NACHT family NTPase
VFDYLGSFGQGRLAIRRFRKLYDKDLKTTHQYLRILGFSAAGISRPQLEQVFISLRVSPFDRTRAFVSNSADSGVSFEKAVARFQRIVILGGPGAGKTTTLSYIVLQLLRGRASELFGTQTQLLPIFVPLRRLSARDTSLLDDLMSPETQILPADRIKDCPPGYIASQMDRGGCVILLDGLDEVIDDATHQLAAKKINRLVEDYPRNRYIVTCRIAGWRGLLDEFAILETEDFNRFEVHRFVFGWHRAIVTNEYRTQIELEVQDAEERESAWKKKREEVQNEIDSTSRGLLNVIDGSARLMAVATNPMLLSLT